MNESIKLIRVEEEISNKECQIMAVWFDLLLRPSIVYWDRVLSMFSYIYCIVDKCIPNIYKSPEANYILAKFCHIEVLTKDHDKSSH